jgi:hypothetical protein
MSPRRVKSVTASLSKRDRQLARALGELGITRPVLTVAAMRETDVKPQTAYALLMKETSGGRNIFGCDFGRTGGAAPFCHEHVTEARYRSLRALGKPNGVGRCQLTSFGFLDEADRKGGAWKDFPNMLVGFGLIGRLIREHGVEAGANRYNGGDSSLGERNGADAGYGREFVQHRDHAQRVLRGSGFEV